MVKKLRRNTEAYKFWVALEAVEGSKTISQFSSEHRDSCQPDSGLETAAARRRAQRFRQEQCAQATGAGGASVPSSTATRKPRDSRRRSV